MISFQVEEYDDVASTNEVVKHALEQGKSEGLAVCARTQTKGYGRQGRYWSSPQGGLYMSVLLRPVVALQQLPTLSLVVGLAVRRALMRLMQVPGKAGVKVKWPNDVVWEGDSVASHDCESMSGNHASSKSTPFQKLCGISLEQHAGGVCVGIGINVERPVEEVSVVGKNMPAYVAELCAECNAASATIAQTRDAVLSELATYYEQWRQLSFGHFVDEYDQASALKGRHVVITSADGSPTASGTVRGCDEYGRLLIASHSGVAAISSGEAHVSCLS